MSKISSQKGNCTLWCNSQSNPHAAQEKKSSCFLRPKIKIGNTLLCRIKTCFMSGLSRILFIKLSRYHQWIYIGVECAFFRDYQESSALLMFICIWRTSKVFFISSTKGIYWLITKFFCYFRYGMSLKQMICEIHSFMVTIFY